MHISTTRAFLVAVVTCALTGGWICPRPAVAQTSPSAGQGSAAGNGAQDAGWPRRFETADNEVLVFAPQVDEWARFDRITFRAAVTVGPKGQPGTHFGILRVSASTDVAYDDRIVVLTDRKVEGLNFPGVDAAEAERLKGIVLAAMPPDRPQTVSLDRLVAALDVSKVDVRRVNVNTAPPKILSSTSPAVMVMFMGKPRFKPVPGGDLQYSINTNWDVFLDPASGAYYLLDGKSWLTTTDLEGGAWTAATSLPVGLSALPADDNWNEVRAAVPGVPSAVVPAVFVTFEPAELIVTDGAPKLEAIPGTALSVVTNTESHLFFHGTEQQYYLLAGGRWFKSGALAGPWAAASGSLPVDFRNIPDSPRMAEVLAAVPGTAEANEAVILASIPQKATITRDAVTVNVVYDGAPKFVPIESTTVQYAYNSPFSVFLVDGGYYCCHDAVWFQAPAASGPWSVCTSVPAAIYTIPPTSPKYNVTYVTVYSSTPTTVVTGYTAGYSGATVAATGAVMFGMGMVAGAALSDECCWSYHYPPSYFSYGCGAVYHGAAGGFVCANSVYGPYGGAGHAAAYNPSTGVYSRGGYAYGPNGAAGYRTAYNPATGTSAARAGGANAYGSWGSSAVTNGDKWATASHTTTARGTTGNIQTSSGAAAATAQGRYGNGATVAKSSSGDYYAAHDGNVYKNSGSGWEQANSQGRGATQASRSTSEELQQQSAARSRGEANSARASQYRGGGGRGRR